GLCGIHPLTRRYVTQKDMLIMDYQGSCHCGAITFSFSMPEIDTGLKCNCSLCQKKNAMMSNFTLSSNELTIESKDDALSTYTFGSNIAKHHFCRVCGIYPFHQTLRKPGHYRINLSCIDNLDLSSLNVEYFNGRAL
ncbi:GFA family protein, partial [Vibrio vulnificus]|nr:GFA family protein [Vibrio vulnificus]